MIRELSTPRYGTSLVNNSHKTTPNDQTSIFSEHFSLRMTSGAMYAYVPANDILVLCSLRCLLVPKSLILSILSSLTNIFAD